MIWWVTVRGKGQFGTTELFYVIEADSHNDAVIKASQILGVQMLDEVTSVTAERG